MSDPLWYKDALIYELHVRAFFDSNADGSGDFRGLTQKLDYLADLGVTALWLLPFYPSPLRDDGYDIADYTRVHADYGTLGDFKVFVKQAHERGLRVITELVCNHTSDQHPWFQRARRAPAGSALRDWYVWSDTPDRYLDARIIFKDFETSNWTWDPVANAYYWHRFYSHQPDLNFENPRVREQIKKSLDFWFELGVDGLRLDAIPYLYEEEGTNCENLPRTHEFLKELRAHIDANFEDRMLLAEANQWPEDAVAYFGNGDECHMCFHFPVMPRLFMSVRMEDRYPIYDIMAQTPAIPDTAQWALFLRNHDELTLEMVTDEERDYMYRVYADDPVMRINLGIRRRLAPLLGNHRRRIELLNGLLFSLPGTPVIYYGDEIGMGDNVYLGDRNGVRTPMQWSGDRNAGFSTANSQRLFLPPITEPEYHFQSINVEAQQNNQHSLLWWMKRLIALRRQHQAFGRGSLTFLHPDNRRIVAFVREYGDEKILVVANTSRFVQYVELDVSAHRGLVPVEMFGRVEFPRVEDRPLVLTLGPHAFLWFSLEADPTGRGHEVRAATEPPPQIIATPELEAILAGVATPQLMRLLPGYLRARRWFRSKARRIKSVSLREAMPMSITAGEAVMALFAVDYTEGEAETYALPLALAPAHGVEQERIAREFPQAIIARVGNDIDPAAGHWILYDALYDPSFASGLLDAIGTRKRIVGRRGQVAASPTAALRALIAAGPGGTTLPATAAGLEVRPNRSEQSNTSVTFGDRLILKLFRRIESGINPDLEIGQMLTANAFPHVPAVAGWLAYRAPRAEPAALAILQQFVPNQGDAWEFTLDQVGAYYERAVTVEVGPDGGRTDVAGIVEASAAGDVPEQARELIGTYLDSARLLGERTAELHRALSANDDPAFTPEPFTALYQRSVYQTMRAQASATLALLGQRLAELPAGTQPDAEEAIARSAEIQQRLRAVLDRRVESRRIRCHGDFHLGQVLWTGRDFVFIDFEGEPGRPLAERRHKRSALTDVAGMLRSFHYAALGTLLSERVGGSIRPDDVPRLAPWATFWYRSVAVTYLRAYRAAAAGANFLSPSDDELVALLSTAMLNKVLYELTYELNSRPDWVSIPLRGLLDLLGPLPDQAEAELIKA
jgi:maltose alpha-D-glucosyltransferase/alpha-amylase